MTEMTAGDLDAYESIAADPRYRHFINIPERVTRCLDHFGIKYSHADVGQRLRVYYLFIGVVDEAIDFGAREAGEDILARLQEASFVSSPRKESMPSAI